MLVTVAICTWNRAKLLEQTLRTMQGIALPGIDEWQLIVVNNNSTDDTDTVIARYADTLPITPLFEPRAGKSFAANLALEHARGDLMIWTDDDVLVESDWITNYVAAAKRWPAADFFAGAIDPWFETPPPRWARNNLTRLNGVYAIANYGTQERRLGPTESVYGANMAFRMRVARQFPLNTALGRTKAELVGGDDTDLIRRVTDTGHWGACVPSAKVRHFVPAKRLEKEYLWKWYRGAGRNLVITGAIPRSKEIFGVPRWVVMAYLVERAKAALWSPLANECWFAAFTQSARMRGVMQEYRQQKTAAKFVTADFREQSVSKKGSTSSSDRK